MTRLNPAEVELAYVLRKVNSDPVEFSRGCRILVRPEQAEILGMIRAGGQVNLASSEPIERAVVLGTLWRVLRKPGGFALVWCPSHEHALAWMRFAHGLCHEQMLPEIARHIEFPAECGGRRMRVAGRASWGIALATREDQIRGHEHRNLTVVELEAARTPPNVSELLADLLAKAEDPLRISVW